MAQVVGGGQIKLNNGQTITPQQGGWYDAQQFWGGTLSAPGVINSQSNQQGAGQAVSKEVVQQTNPANWDYIQQQAKTYQQQNNVVADAGAGFGGGGTGGGGAVADLGAFGGGGTGAAINLPDMYKTLSTAAGIGDKEAAIAAKTKGFNDAQAKINDNPYLSEASRTGRIQKLTMDYNNNIKNDQDALVMAKQDIQTQIDLQSKQFDINSQTAKAALDEFNMLLTSGALAGASGNDIASITKATGISSGEISAAIRSQQVKDTPTAVQTVDDGTNIYSVVLNTKTGAIISKQVLSASKPSTSGTGSTKLDPNDVTAGATTAAKGGKTLSDMMVFYQQYGMSPQQIYSVYNAVNYYKPTSAQKIADQTRYGVK